MAQQLVAAFLVLGLLVATLWLLSRKGFARLNLALPKRPAGPKRMQTLDRLALTAHHSLHLIQVENRTILIAVSPSGCHSIAMSAELFMPPEEFADEIR